ncbi:hypothetical protein RHSIM_Rhsim09G0064300 [Rhododendron simsii]|uniref:Protein kinase domain-containing protein n=1 Tax=Rhododendron simsii TaxID=118357 RepID=A0A834GJE3_RHOSS|nr:hypothetical protein RHSIM_Rhsim09G0064300 [Rhododendron simsii]
MSGGGGYGCVGDGGGGYGGWSDDGRLKWEGGDGSDDLEKIAAREQKQFPFETLVSATKNFHPNHKLGEGGFGPVFKGKLEDGREIAVKKLSQSSRQGKKEFTNEAKLLARVQHRNVVNLLGYCVHGAEKLLVYEYVANESLDKLLFKSLDADDVLNWLYNSGYMAPEYLMHGHLSVKADVFSFGVVILELISGQKNSTFNLSLDSENLLEWAYKQYRRGKSLEVMDPKLVSSAVPDQVAMCLQIGLLCTQLDPQVRPTMRRVVVMLSKKPGSLEEPTRPGYPGARRRRSSTPATSSSLTGTSSESSSQAFGSTTNNNSASATASTSTSYLTSPRLDPHGKRPMQ